MNRCLYDRTEDLPEYNGVCKAGKSICPYYFVDPILAIMTKWITEIGLGTPVLYKLDRKKKKMIVYTTEPGKMIGYNGTLVNKYNERLKPLLSRMLGTDPESDMFILFERCDDCVVRDRR